MRLRAAVVPPPEAVAHLAAALHDRDGEQDQIAWTPPEHWTLNIATFGHIARGDEERIIGLLADEVAGVPPVQLWLGGVEPLPEDGDNGVWVNVHGDTDAMAEIASALPSIVKPAGFMLDRRSFRPRIQLGKITMRTTLPYLERLEARLNGYQGSPWVSNVLTFGHEAVIGSTNAETYEFVVEAELPLQGARASAGS